MRVAVVAIAVLAATSCTPKVLTKLVAAECPRLEPDKLVIDPKLYEHVPEHKPIEISDVEAKRLALVRLGSIQQCNAKLDKLKDATQ